MGWTRGDRMTRGAVLLVALALLAGCNALGIGSTGADEAADEPVAPAPVSSSAPTELETFIDEIPPADLPDLDMQTALTLVAMPLSCLDRPHAAPSDRSTYLDEFVAARRPGYERERAFYGCWDWHSAVNSTWAMVRIYKAFPELPVAGLVREKLRDHLSGQALQGETEFFRSNIGFERPYGYAWLLKLYAELRTWDYPDAERWANNLEPLATLFSERMVAYLPRLQRPSRSGAHSNTAFSLALMLEYAEITGDVGLHQSITAASRRLFGDDVGCPTGYEPWGADFLSPCLEEAALMAAVLEPGEFVAWFDEFMPPVTAREFLPLTTPVYDPRLEESSEGEAADAAAGQAVDETESAAAQAGEEAAGTAADPVETGAADEPESDESTDESDEQAEREATRELASRSHLIGLAFIRADAMNRIADALPAGDPRIEAYRRLARLHGSMGFEAMFDADYAGSHWIGTFALKYLLTEERARP